MAMVADRSSTELADEVASGEAGAVLGLPGLTASAVNTMVHH